MALIHLTIVTPQGRFFDEDAQKVIVRTTGGDVCILPNHIDYAAALGDHDGRLTTQSGEVRRFNVAGGMLHVADNQVQIIANRFEWLEKG